MFGFNGNRRRSFDRTDNEQNSTGYSEKTVFPTDFGNTENNNFQNGGYTQAPPQNSGFDGGYAQNSVPNNGGYTQPAAPQNYAYAQSAAPVATAQMSGLPMVFASRTHTDVYVYEYPDRLEWYLKTATCMHLFNIDRKK